MAKDKPLVKIKRTEAKPLEISLPEKTDPITTPDTTTSSSKLTNAGNVVSNASWATPYKFWKKMTFNPLGSALATTALAGGTAYMAAPLVAKLFGRLNNQLPGQLRRDVQDQDIEKFRRRLTWMAALGAGGLSVLSNLDTRKPWKSMTNWDYMNKNASEKEEPDYENITKEEVLHKLAGWGMPVDQNILAMDYIPLDHAKEIVANDKFLTSDQKAAIGTIFDKTGSDTETGNTSMADLTAGAVRAGLGFAGGAIAGYALGKIFSLPASVTRAASVTGGLANALRSSGLIT
jgi:hypothetical protein